MQGWLVVSRKQGEIVRIKCGDKEILLCVADIDRGKIRLGFRADKDVEIMRQELIEKTGDGAK